MRHWLVVGEDISGNPQDLQSFGYIKEYSIQHATQVETCAGQINLQRKGQIEFVSQDLGDWSSEEGKSGTFKEVRTQIAGNDHETRFTCLTVTGAGHMVIVFNSMLCDCG
jgi:hypothetical protein